jgi:replicative DNA helicase
MLHPDPETKGADLDYPVVHLIVAKHRQGACRRFKLSFEKRYTRMLPMADPRDMRLA